MLPDGSALDPSNRALLSEEKKGRHVTILGDTRNARWECKSSIINRRMGDLVRNSDVLVHEATIGPILQDVIPKEGMKRLCGLWTEE